jgi:hypothetical protein
VTAVDVEEQTRTVLIETRTTERVGDDRIVISIESTDMKGNTTKATTELTRKKMESK